MAKKNKAFFCIYPPAYVNELELWLKEKSRDGYRLVNSWFCWYMFEMSLCTEREYFVYSPFDGSKGISFDYHIAKARYRNKASALNANNQSIFEVDFKKIDSDYHLFKQLRNKYYFRHYCALSSLYFFFSTIFFIVAFQRAVFLWFALPAGLMLIYNFISLIAIHKHLK